MINLKTIATLLTEKPTSVIMFNIHDSSYIVTSNIEILRAEKGYMLKGRNVVKGIPDKLIPLIENRDDYVELFDYSKNFKDDMSIFISMHKSSFSKLTSANDLTFRNFVKYLKEINLYDEWIEYFEVELSYDVYYWCLYTDQYEEEADKEQYDSIIELLDKYKSYEFEKVLSDKVLFSIFDDYDPFSFIVLGNEGITKGISFVLGYNATSYFKLLYSENLSNIDERLFNNLSNTVSFYTDEDEEYFENNPFEGKGTYSCVNMVSGYYAKNRLSKSLANLCIKYLAKAIYLLSRFVDSSKILEIDDDNLFIVDHELVVTNISEDNKVIPPIDFDRDAIYPLEKGRMGYSSVDFRVCGLNSYISDEKDPRIVFPNIMALFTDHETGKIQKAVLAKPNMYHPLASLSDAIRDELKDYRIPKIINVNNMYDELFASCLFMNFIENNTTKLNIVDHELLIDSVVESFNEEFSNFDPYHKA